MNIYKKLRTERNMTQKELAKKLDITQSEISKLEKGSDPRQGVIKSYCDYFNCSADYLLGIIKRPTHKKHTIGELTGLSDKAIENLQRLKKYKKGIDVLNFIMDYYSSFATFLDNIHLFLNSGEYDTPVHYDEHADDYVESPDGPPDSDFGTHFLLAGKKIVKNDKDSFEALPISLSIVAESALNWIRDNLREWKKGYIGKK